MEAPNFYRQDGWNPESMKNYVSVKQIKKHLQQGNCSYLSRHPEVRAIIRVLLHELINREPENIHEFSAALFNCNNSPLLVTKINQQLELVNKLSKESKWSKYDGEDFVAEKETTESLISENSLSKEIDDILRYAMILKDEK